MAITTYGKVRYPLKTPYRDVTTGDRRSHMIFEPLDFIARLAEGLSSHPSVYRATHHNLNNHQDKLSFN